MIADRLVAMAAKMQNTPTVTRVTQSFRAVLMMCDGAVGLLYKL